MSEFGWEIYNENGVLVANNSVIMSRRLGSYSVPFVSSAWSTVIPVELNGGTPFAHVQVSGQVRPSDGAIAVAVPDIIFNGNGTMTIRYTDRHWAWPMDDVGSIKLYLGGVIVNYGVYNQ